MRVVGRPIVAVILVAIALFGLPASLSASVSTSSAPTLSAERSGLQASCKATRTFRGSAFSFNYSPCWTASTFREVSSFAWLDVVLSDQTTHNPCRTSTDSTGVQTACTWPIGHLKRSHVLVEWFEVGHPGWHLTDEPGVPITVAGRAARERIVHHGCPQIGGDEMVSIEISKLVPDNFFQVTACLRSPDDTIQLQRLSTMLKSVKWLGS